MPCHPFVQVGPGVRCDARILGLSGLDLCTQTAVACIDEYECMHLLHLRTLNMVMRDAHVSHAYQCVTTRLALAWKMRLWDGINVVVVRMGLSSTYVLSMTKLQFGGQGMRRLIDHASVREHTMSPIMTAEETSRWLGFQSVNALLRARKRGSLPVPMFQLPGRRGWFAATRAVVGWAEACTEPYLTFEVASQKEEL